MSGPIFPEGAFWRVPVASWQEYRDHLVRLSPGARHSRFGGAVSEELLARHARQSLERGAEVHGWFAGGVMRGAFELCRLDDPRRAEVAFTVEDDFQARGVGTGLFARTLRLAKARGLRELVVVCLPSNTRMQAVAAKFGGQMKWYGDEVVALVEAPEPTVFSAWREIVEETADFLTVLADRARPVRRPPSRRAA